jgi:nucleotide-binding universal stress UspA family protein
MTTPPMSSDQSDGQADDTTSTPTRVVVGVDGSAGSLAALRWAAQEASLRGVGVHVVTAWQRQRAYGSANVFGVGMDPTFDTEESLAAAAAEEAVHLAEQARKERDVPMTWATVEGHPAMALLAVVEEGDILVVGSRGHGGFVSALLGSVGQHVVTHARCPVVVIPGAERHQHVTQV